MVSVIVYVLTVCIVIIFMIHVWMIVLEELIPVIVVLLVVNHVLKLKFVRSI